MSNTDPNKLKSGPQTPDFSDADSVPAVQKRSAARVAVSAPVQVVFYDALNDHFKDKPGIAVNACLNGICIEAPMRLEKELPVMVRTNHLNSAADSVCHGEVKWCRRNRTVLENVAYHVGIGFYEPVNTDWL